MMVNATRRRRIFAFTIETFVMSTLLGIVLVVQTALVGGSATLATFDPTGTVGLATLAAVLLANAAGLIVVSFLMALYLLWAMANGGSFACKLMGIEIVNKEGQAPGWVAAFVRTLVNGLGWSFTGGLHTLVHLFTEDKGGLHDIVAGTRVVTRL